MADRPTDFPTFATNTNYSTGPDNGTATKIAFTGGEIANGNIKGPGYAPNAKKYNWWMNLVGRWVLYIDEKITELLAAVEVNIPSMAGRIFTGIAPSASNPAFVVNLAGPDVYLTSVNAFKEANGALTNLYAIQIELSTNGGSSYTPVANDSGAGNFSAAHMLHQTWDTPFHLGTDGRIRISTYVNSGGSQSHNLQVAVTYIIN